SNTLCIHEDALKKGDRVVIIDDLLATGGTVKATINLCERLGATVVGIACLIELVDLKGRKLLEGYDVLSLMEYEGE
ncbi:MAG: adenine phosphoribosyltransferase, partial [Anaeroplasmataceae bacterium]|nr:adenine phosphoribosyltransferase [Anaeroplasmataceae bacterium]